MNRPALPKPSREEHLARLCAEFGMPLAEHSRDLWRPLALIVIAGTVFVLSGPFLAGLIERREYGLLAALVSLASAVSFVALMIGVAQLWGNIRVDGYRICPEGFILLRWHSIESCRWSDVDTVRFFKKDDRWGVFRRLDGTRIVLRGLNLEIEAFLEAAICRAQMPRTVDALNAGREVAFGKVTVTRDGVHHRETLIPWAEIADVEWRQQLSILRRDNTRIYLFDVPNLTLFMALVRDRLSRGGFPTREQLAALLQ